jgi:hypothetical protein
MKKRLMRSPCCLSVSVSPQIFVCRLMRSHYPLIFYVLSLYEIKGYSSQTKGRSSYSVRVSGGVHDGSTGITITVGLIGAGIGVFLPPCVVAMVMAGKCFGYYGRRDRRMLPLPWLRFQKVAFLRARGGLVTLEARFTL